MADYYNAREILPAELMREVMEHVPKGSRNGALVYFSEDYYARRNAEIVSCFLIYQADPNFGSQLEIYEALSEQFGLTVRRICRILKEGGDHGERRVQVRRRFSGIRVDRCSRRMKVRTAAP
jgi:hypothetical protein